MPVPLYKIPYGGRYRLPDSDVEYIHERGDGMYPWVRNTDTGALEKGYIGQEVEPCEDNI